jgi:ankyrin repeat protein
MASCVTSAGGTCRLPVDILTQSMRGYCITTIALGLAATARAQNAPDELIQLIRDNDLATLKTLPSNGNGINTHDARGTTLLMYAAGFGTADAVKLLLSKGADVNAKNQFDMTALVFGAGNHEKARLLVEKGADVNVKTKGGRTPLMIASACDGCSPTVKLLLDKGADPKAVDGHKVSALHIAADANDLESMKLLIAKGADPKMADGAGNTPLPSAASNCNLDAVKFLLSKGADPNAGNSFANEVKFGKIQLIGLTPLMMGSTYCSPELVKTLLDAGAKVDATDVRGMTPLMFAVSSEEQNLAVAHLLIKAGAAVNAKTKTGETALDWAKRSGNPQVLAALNEAGAKEGLAYQAPARKGAADRPVLQAVEKGTAILQQGASGFFKQAGCVGCHHQTAALIAMTAARQAGVKVDENEAKGYIKMMEGASTTLQPPLIERNDVGGLTDGWVSMLFAMHGEHYSSSPLTDVLVTYVANFQRRDGSWWLGGVARPPFEEGYMQRTAMGLRSLQLYGTPALKAEFDKRIARSRDYLLKARARTNDEAAMQILGLHWSPGSEDKMRALAKTLIASQRPDGGWGQNPNLPSDAYATGETLWALQESHTLKVSDPVYQKAVKYLLGTQWEDGSWYVRSRAPKFQPYFQSGFPHDHDQWISSAATSWAVRALAPAVENEKRASR